ncbi:MAG: tetratricopeptide repeat protein [Candidatus Brocadiia bacterium]
MKALTASVLLLFVFLSSIAFSEGAKGPAEDFFDYGIKLMDEGRYAEAAEEFDKAIDLKADYLEAYLQRGICHVYTEELPAALNDLSLVISKDLANYRAYFWRARAYRGSGDVKQALLDCSRCIQAAPTWVPGYELKGDILLEQGDVQAAYESYKKAVEVAPGEADLMMKKGRTEIMIARFDDAIATMDDILKILPKFYEACYLRADARMGKKDFAGAEADINLGISFDPWKESPTIFFRRGLVRLLSSRFDGAAGDFKSATASSRPEKARYIVYLCLTLKLGGRTFEANERASMAKDMLQGVISDDEFKTRWSLIFSYIRGDSDESTLIDAAIANLEDREFAGLSYFCVAMVNLAAGKENRSIECFYRVTELSSPKFPECSVATTWRSMLEAREILCPPKPKAEAEPPAPEKPPEAKPEATPAVTPTPPAAKPEQ